jgi:hypothetical protein
MLDPSVLRLFIITVIRLTHDGMPVKSIAVPDVEATAVPETSGYSVPVVPATVPVAVIVPANVVFSPVLIEMASEPPIWTAPDPSEFPFNPIGNLSSFQCGYFRFSCV